jgi:hypothetical protein
MSDWSELELSILDKGLAEEKTASQIAKILKDNEFNRSVDAIYSKVKSVYGTSIKTLRRKDVLPNGKPLAKKAFKVDLLNQMKNTNEKLLNMMAEKSTAKSTAKKPVEESEYNEGLDTSTSADQDEEEYLFKVTTQNIPLRHFIYGNPNGKRIICWRIPSQSSMKIQAIQTVQDVTLSITLTVEKFKLEDFKDVINFGDFPPDFEDDIYQWEITLPGVRTTWISRTSLKSDDKCIVVLIITPTDVMDKIDL